MFAFRAKNRRRIARRSVLPSLCLSFCLVPPVFGLGLGSIELKSPLGEPLHAEIPLLSLGDLSDDQIRVQLGSAEDYLRMQVERTLLHTRFELEPVLDAGRAYIRLTTRERVNEPFLNFVINVRWPQGRFAREFTLLLDPPQPGTQAAIQGVSYDDKPAFTPAVVAAGRGGAGVRTRRGDTLWGVAQQLRRPGVNLQQTMNAIVATNPHAFLGGDPERLKAGVHIVLPAGVTQVVAAGETVPPAVAAAKSAPASAELRQSLARLERGVNDLHGELADSRQRLQRMEARLSDVILGYQRLAGTGPLPGELVAAVREDVLEDLRSLDISKLPVSPVIATAQAQTATLPQQGSNWWLHGSYLALLLGAGVWLLRSRLRPARPLAAVAAPSDREILDALALRLSGPGRDVSPAPARPAPRTFVKAPDEPDEVIDPLLEAGAYIAFAQYDRAEAVLRQAIKEQPGRGELKLKLLDVYSRSGQEESRTQLIAELEAGADAGLAAEARQYSRA